MTIGEQSMAKPLKNYKPGKGGKRLNVILSEDEWKKFEDIRAMIKGKFGEGTATDASVVRASLLHFWEHVERGEVE
jgi:hypothetical protein